MKIYKFVILIGAAWAGTMIYRFQRAFTPPPGSYSDSNARSVLTGEGSLYQSLEAAGLSTQGVTASNNYEQQYGGGLGKVGAGAGRTALAQRNSLNSGGTSARSGPSANDVALMQSAAKGDTDEVEKLLAAHAKIESRDPYRRTPLMYASWNGHQEVIERLMAAGADPGNQDIDENTAMDYAAGRGLLDVVNYLIKASHSKDDHHYAEYATLIQAAYAGDASKIPAGNLSSINRVNPEGQSPLHIAAGNGSYELAEALIKHGADVNISNKDKQTPLHWAAWNNQTALVDLLIKKGANISAPDRAGNTPLILATLAGGDASVKMLLEKGADRYIANREGKTAAIIAEDKGNKDLAAELR